MKMSIVIAVVYFAIFGWVAWSISGCGNNPVSYNEKYLSDNVSLPVVGRVTVYQSWGLGKIQKVLLMDDVKAGLVPSEPKILQTMGFKMSGDDGLIYTCDGIFIQWEVEAGYTGSFTIAARTYGKLQYCGEQRVWASWMCNYLCRWEVFSNSN